MSQPHQSPALPVGIAAVAAVSYVLCDVLHELGHAAATLLPLGVRALSISTIGLTTDRSNPVVASAGPLLNLLLAVTLALVRISVLPPVWRYAAWLFGTVNLLNAAAYLVYSAVLGSGDVAVVFNAIASHWRVWVGACGLAAYAAAVVASRAGLLQLVQAGVLDTVTASKCCTLSYWCGGLLLTAGAVFNPVSPLLILTSGAAVGFGAMASLPLLPSMFPKDLADNRVTSLRISWSWVITGVIAAAVFVGLLGPGMRLAR